MKPDLLSIKKRYDELLSAESQWEVDAISRHLGVMLINALPDIIEIIEESEFLKRYVDSTFVRRIPILKPEDKIKAGVPPPDTNSHTSLCPAYDPLNQWEEGSRPCHCGAVLKNADAKYEAGKCQKCDQPRQKNDYLCYQHAMEAEADGDSI